MTVLMALAAMIAQQYDPMANWHLQDDHFSVSGIYCHGGGCTSLPRIRDSDVLFDFARSKSTLTNATQLSSPWSVTLDCKRVTDHFEQCRPANGQSGTNEIVEIAEKLLRNIHVDAAQLKARHAGARAIVSVEYDNGFCPSWRCIPIPPPSRPPAAN